MTTTKSKSTSITEKLKTFEDACSLQGIKTHGDAFKILKLNRTLCAEISINQCDDDLLKIMIIERGLNEEWWPSQNEERWFPIFHTSSGFGFSGSIYGRWHSDADCGSRLCLRNKKLSDYMGTQFTPLFKNILII